MHLKTLLAQSQSRSQSPQALSVKAHDKMVLDCGPRQVSDGDQDGDAVAAAAAADVDANADADQQKREAVGPFVQRLLAAGFLLDRVALGTHGWRFSVPK